MFSRRYFFGFTVLLVAPNLVSGTPGLIEMAEVFVTEGDLVTCGAVIRGVGAEVFFGAVETGAAPRAGILRW